MSIKGRAYCGYDLRFKQKVALSRADGKFGLEVSLGTAMVGRNFRWRARGGSRCHSLVAELIVTFGDVSLNRLNELRDVGPITVMRTHAKQFGAVWELLRSPGGPRIWPNSRAAMREWSVVGSNLDGWLANSGRSLETWPPPNAPPMLCVKSVGALDANGARCLPAETGLKASAEGRAVQYRCHHSAVCASREPRLNCAAQVAKNT